MGTGKHVIASTFAQIQIFIERDGIPKAHTCARRNCSGGGGGLVRYMICLRHHKDIIEAEGDKLLKFSNIYSNPEQFQPFQCNANAAPANAYAPTAPPLAASTSVPVADFTCTSLPTGL